MKVVALCNKLSRSRSAKLRGDDLEVNGSGDMATLGVLSAEVIARTSPCVSNMAAGREAVEGRYPKDSKLYQISTCQFYIHTNILRYS